jgi:hypothetical protein
MIFAEGLGLYATPQSRLPQGLEPRRAHAFFNLFPSLGARAQA